MGRIREKNRWRCGACCAVNLEPDLPTAPSPFDPTDTITACPNCKQCNEGFELLCDEPGCNVVAGCGWPTGDDQDEWGGYRNTCSLHMQQKTGADPQTIQEAAAELRRQHARIAELEARIKTMAEEHADELMVAHMDGRMRAEQAAPAAIHSDLRARCVEVLAWQETGTLPGEALRTLAREKYGDRYDAIQRAERDTETEALNLVAAAPTTQPAPRQEAQEPVAWYVTGCGRLLDEDEAKAEARRIGGTARAMPLYTAPQADSQPAGADRHGLPPLPDPDLRDVGTNPEDIKNFLRGYATEYAKVALAAHKQGATHD